MAEVARITIVVDAADPPAAAADGDLDQCRHALQEEQARNHQLSEYVRTIEAQQAAQNELLRERTIERDHFKEDSYLWGLVVAWYAAVNDGVLVVRTAELQQFHGSQLNGVEADGWTTITVGERLPPSPEGA